MYIANRDITSAQCLAAGCDPANNYNGAQMDAIVEVDRSGNVIWEWWFFDHVVQDISSGKSTYGVVKDNPGKIDLNMRGNPVKSDWLHCNSMDYNEDLDLVVVNSVHGEFYVIDHGNTFIAGKPDSSIMLAASTKGDFLDRFGDPAKYDQGDPPSVLDNWEKATSGHKQMGGAHNIQWIKSGLPGAGNFMIFNNGQNLFELTPQSYIYEINPYLNSSGTNTGKFVNPPIAGYNIVNSPDRNLMKEKKNVSKQIVWKYSSKNNTSFFSTIGSGVQRLPNGNTFVCSMNDGHFFEVSPADTLIVWEYINPLTRDGKKKIKVDNYPTYNAALRAYRYTSDHPALKDKDLTAGETITGFDPDYLTPSDITSSEPTGGFAATGGDQLSQNYPNPFSYNTSISFDLENGKKVTVVIFDLSGKQVRSLLNQGCPAGRYNLTWDGTNDEGIRVPNGMYFYILTADNQKISKKMIYSR
jgi:hypothetical protein